MVEENNNKQETLLRTCEQTCLCDSLCNDIKDGTAQVAPFPDDQAGLLNRVNAKSEDHAWIQYQLARFRDKTRG